ncbi:RluA family pseudouridine synthase, partial [Gemmiger formicilis]|uniref:pseudouridine synthase n=1 Tax=Gemmiger formicilis TaxID=745368 RepID=UPI001D6CA05C
VQNGDVIRLFLNDDQLEKKPLPPAVFVYEDDDLIIANKPAGIEVDGPASDTLLKRVQATLSANSHSAQAVLCHRLDTGTSGLILLAKNKAAEHFLTEAIKAR